MWRCARGSLGDTYRQAWASGRPCNGGPLWGWSHGGPQVSERTDWGLSGRGCLGLPQLGKGSQGPTWNQVIAEDHRGLATPVWGWVPFHRPLPGAEQGSKPVGGRGLPLCDPLLLALTACLSMTLRARKWRFYWTSCGSLMECSSLLQRTSSWW